MVSGPWIVAVGLGSGNSDAIETVAPKGLIDLNSTIRVGFTSRVGDARDALLTDGADPILLINNSVAIAPKHIPALPLPGLVTLILLVAVMAGALRHRMPRGTQTLMLLALIGCGIGVVWAAADGDLGEWSGIQPLSRDMAGDSQPEADIIDVYFQQVGTDTLFRFDIAGLRPDSFAPTLNLISDPAAIPEGSAQQRINLSGISAGGSENQPLEVTASSDNRSVIDNVSVSYTSPENTAIIAYTPNPDANGVATITVSVTDGGPDNDLGTTADNLSIMRTFVATVTGVNDAPTFSASNPPTIDEDSPPQTISGWVTAFSAGPADEATQTVEFLVSNISNDGAFTVGPAVNAAGDLSYELAADANDSIDFDITIRDDGGTANGGIDLSPPQRFTLMIVPIDDSPLAVNDTQSVTEDSGANLIDVLADDIDNDGGAMSIASVTQPTNGTVVIESGGSGLSYKPNLNYCKSDSQTDDFIYTLNPGGSSATVNVTVVCVADPPETAADAYTTVGNTELVAADAPPASLAHVTNLTSLLANDSDPVESGKVRIVALGMDTTEPFEADTTLGGNVTVYANGSFSYRPPRGLVSQEDTFTYTAGNDAGAQATGQVSITISDNRVWYVHNAPETEPLNPVDNNAAGRSDDPFDTLAQADFNNSLSGPGDLILVFAGDGSDNGMNSGVELTENQILVGHYEATLDVGMMTIQTPSPGARPKINNTTDGGSGVTVSDRSGVEIRSLAVSGNAHGIDITATSGARSARVAECELTGSSAGHGLNAESTGSADLEIAFVNNSVVSSHTSYNGASFTGASLTAGSGTLTITELSRPSSPATAIPVGTAIRANTVSFDADTTTEGFQPVDATSLIIGDRIDNSRAQGAGLNLENVQGELNLGAIDIYSSDGTAVHANSTGPYSGNSGFKLAISSGTIDTTGNGGRAFNLTGIKSLINVSGIICSNNSDCITINNLDSTSTTTLANASLSCTGGTCFNANGAGTVTVTGATNTINATNAVGLNLTKTTIGADGATFHSISASGAANGIILDTTGSIGAFLVSGNGSTARDASGGTISNTTGSGVLLKNANAVTLQQIDLISNRDHGIAGNGGSNHVLSAVTIQSSDSHGWEAINLQGTNRIDKGSLVTQLTGVGQDGVRVKNTNTDFDSFTVDTVTFSELSSGNDGFSFSALGSTAGSLGIANSTFTRLDGDGAQIINGGTGTISASVEKNTFTTSTYVNGNNGLALSLIGNGQFNFTVDNNIFTDVNRNSAPTGVINVIAAGPSTNSDTRINGTISNNSISNSTGSRGISALFEASAGSGHGGHSLTIDNNTIDNVAREGIRVDLKSVAGRSNDDNAITITNNSVGFNSVVAAAGVYAGLRIDTRHDSTTNGSITANLLVKDNKVQTNQEADTVQVINDAWPAGSATNLQLTVLSNTFRNNNAFLNSFYMWNLDSGSTSYLDLQNNTATGVRLRGDAGKFGIGGMTAGSPTATDVQNFIADRNTGPVNVSGNTFIGGVTCTLP